jgi:hypothetical protein
MLTQKDVCIFRSFNLVMCVWPLCVQVPESCLFCSCVAPLCACRCLVITGMQRYDEIDKDAPFSVAFAKASASKALNICQRHIGWQISS